MATADTIPMLEVTCPEFYITHIAKIESAGGDNFRLWCCILRNGTLEPMCTMVVPKDFLARNSAQCIEAVATQDEMAGLPRH